MGLDGDLHSQGLLPGTSSALQTLTAETHPEIFSARLCALAQRLEAQNNDGAAQRLYHALQIWNPDSKWGKLASRRAGILNGGGTLPEKLERLWAKLMPAVADPASLGGMYAGLRVFRGASWGLMTYLGSNAWTHKAAATLGAFALEVPAFTLTQRALRSQFGGVNSHLASPIQDEMIHAAVSLGALKAFGLAGTHAVVGLGQNGITHRLLPQAAMFLGIVGAQGVESAAGLRGFNGTETFLIDATSTWLHFNMAGKILGPLLPSGHHTATPKPSITFDSHALALLPALAGRAPLAGLGIALAKGPRDFFPGFFSKSNSSLSPSPPPASIADSDSPPPLRSSGIQPSGSKLAFDAMKDSFGQFQITIQKLFSDQIPMEQWVQELRPINAQLMRETHTLAEIHRERDPQAPLLPKFVEVQEHLRVIDRVLKEFDVGVFAISPEQVKFFLLQYYRFPNKLVNFIDGADSLEASLYPLIVARQHMEFILEAGEFPKIPLLGEEQTPVFRGEIQRLAAEINQLLLFELDPQWAFKSSMAYREFRSLLSRITSVSREQDQAPYLQELMRGLQTDLDGIIHALDHRVTSNAKGRVSLESHKLIRDLYQVPDSFADFMLDSDVPLLLAARKFARQVRGSLDAKPAQ